MILYTAAVRPEKPHRCSFILRECRDVLSYANKRDSEYESKRNTGDLWRLWQLFKLQIIVIVWRYTPIS